MPNELNRRRFLKAAASTACLTAASAPAAWPVTKRRPNIVLVLGDDHTYRDIGCYGNPEVKTPNMDRLAGEGMRFTRAFTATAMCAPSRQQLYTGLFPIRNGAYPNHSQVYPGTKSLPHYLKALDYRVGLAGKRHFGPAASYPFESVGKVELDFDAMREFVSREPSLPFCMVVCSKSPHCPWSEGDASVYDPEKLTLPGSWVDTPETRQALTRYYAEVTHLDRQVGRCMELVRDAGVEDETLFIYTSEQGSQFPFSKWTCYEAGLHVAFIARWPGQIQPRSTADAMVQYVDVVPTLVEAACGETVSGVDGRSFLPVLRGQTDTHNDAVYGVHTTRGIKDGSECYPIRSIRTATHRYILNLNSEAAFQNVLMSKDREGYWKSWEAKAETDPQAAERVERYRRRPAEELYDVEADPHALHNLADDPKHRELVDSLRKRLEEWMKQQGDRGSETEMRAFERQGNRNKK